MITRSATANVLGASPSGNSVYNDDTPVTTQADIIMTGGQGHYSGGGQSLSAPLTSQSGSLTFAGIQLTYIIKAFNPLWNSTISPYPLTAETPPQISTAINPLLDNPALSGFIYSQ
jgi:hypothetical protein